MTSEFQYDRDGTRTIVDELRGTASYEHDFGKFGRHQIAVLASRREGSADRSSFAFDDIGRNSQMAFRRYIKYGDGPNNTGFDQARVIADGAAAGLNLGWRQNRLNYGASRQDTLQAVHVGNFFSGRLTTVLGIRNDKLFGRSALNGTFDTITTGPLIKRIRQWNNFQLSPWSFAAGDITRTKGLTLGWSAESPVRVYYNEAGSFVNQNVNRFVGLFERNIGPLPRLGEGKDMGVRFQLFDKRVQGSIGHFETMDRNATPGLHGTSESFQFVAAQLQRGTGRNNWRHLDAVSKGYEVEITANDA